MITKKDLYISRAIYLVYVFFIISIMIALYSISKNKGISLIRLAICYMVGFSGMLVIFREMVKLKISDTPIKNRRGFKHKKRVKQ